MDRFRLIGRLLAIFAIAGLVAFPVASPVAAKLLPSPEISDTSTESMSADMSCCPDTQKSNDCQDCPLRAMCTLGVAQLEPPAAIGIPEPLPARRLFAVFDDLIVEGLDGRPPDHPPRLLI